MAPVRDPTLGLEAIEGAQERIRRYVRRTPLTYSRYLSGIARAEVWLKLENLQPTGSFKVRGALSKIELLASEGQPPRIVTGSAGNHGLGVAYAAEALGGFQADIFVPRSAPAAKVEKLRAYAIDLHLEGETYEQAHQAAEAFAATTGATYVQAYDDLDVIAGQGTIGLEILHDLPEPDVILVPVGGGGMIAGVATAVKASRPGCQILGVQPTASPAALLSLRDGRAYDPYDHEPTLADGLAGGFGAVPLQIAKDLIDAIQLVDEPDLRRAVFTLLDRQQLVVEPSGAISIAPLLTESVTVTGKKVVCILSGGNIATSLLRDILVSFSA